MQGQNKVSGVVLAGGRSSRMGQLDKGLMPFQNHPLVSYAIQALLPLTDEVFISANRNQNQYRQFGYPIIADNNKNFDGPLAGILAAMQVAKNAVLLVLPCDTPLITSTHVQRLLSALNENLDIVVAHDGQYWQPTIMAIKTSLQTELEDYLQGGARKLQTWIVQHRYLNLDFSCCPEIFANINTQADLSILENINIHFAED